jgi:hypothetical protein
LPQTPVDFGDRDRPVVEPDECFQELRGDARSERRHDSTVAKGVAPE